MDDAHVACRQLGYYGAKAALHGKEVPDGTGKIWLDNVNCKGNEQFLTECQNTHFGNTDCHHNEDAGVECLTEPGMKQLYRQGTYNK